MSLFIRLEWWSRGGRGEGGEAGGLMGSRTREAATGDVPQSLSAARGAGGVARGCACECAAESGGAGCG